MAVIIISNGEALSQAAKFKLCYAICCLVWALAGFFLGQIRTLQKFGWLANLAVFINLIIMFITMGAAAHSEPLFSASASSAGYSINPKLVKPVNGVYPPVQHSGGLPDPGNFGGSVNGMMQAVYSYGGCMIFPEFMAEIKRPRDFLKGMWGAQLFIYICYMLYGLFMYGYQGQYVQTPAYLGISQYGLSTAGNSLAIVSALIAATLYGNIGIKGKPIPPSPQNESTLTYPHSPVQQRLRGILPRTPALHQTRQIHLDRLRPPLLVHRVRGRRRNPRLRRVHGHRRRSLHPAIHLLDPAAAARGLQHDAQRRQRRGRLRPGHGRSRCAGPRVQPVCAWLLWTEVVP